METNQDLNSKQQTTKFSTRNMMATGAAIALVAAGGFFAYSQISSSNASFISGYGCTSAQTIKKGSRGNCVKLAQSRLNTWSRCTRSTAKKLSVDGVFGSATESRAKSFQTAKKLKADGVIGAATWNQLQLKKVNKC